MRHLLAILLVLSVSGCDYFKSQEAGSINKVTPVPAMDVSTPDRALRTYWALQDWQYARIREIYTLDKGKLKELKSVQDTRNQTIAGDMFKPDYDKPDNGEAYEREIREVKVESESRATISARVRNTTPIPANATPSARDLELREKGEVYRYVLEKIGDGWRVTEVWAFDPYVFKDWRKTWRSRKTAPSVPSDTDGGS